MHLPPPVHGAAVVGENILKSKLINNEFDCIYINLSASKEISTIGKFQFQKIIFLFNNLFNVIITTLKERPQLIYVTPSSWDWGFYRDFIIIMILKLLKKKVVVHFHNKGVDSWSNLPFNKLIYRIFFRNLKVILLAEELYEEKQKYVERKNLFICPNGIPVTQDINKFTKRQKNPTSFLFLSNMMEEKGVWILRDACKILKENGYDYRCIFIGKWSDITQNMFEDQIISLGLEKLAIAYGPKYGDEKNTYFEQADIFVFPTFYHGETFGLVLLEAMEFGLPCISTFEGGIPSVIINGETGLLVKQKDSVELADKMAYLLEHPDLCIKMGQAGRKRFLENFTLETFEKNLVAILRDCLKKRS